MSSINISFKYVDEDKISEQLLCNICMQPLVDPVEHPSSDQNSGCSQVGALYVYVCDSLAVCILTSTM